MKKPKSPTRLRSKYGPNWRECPEYVEYLTQLAIWRASKKRFDVPIELKVLSKDNLLTCFNWLMDHPTQTGRDYCNTLQRFKSFIKVHSWAPNYLKEQVEFQQEQKYGKAYSLFMGTQEYSIDYRT
jgi:hypothetical protein